MNSALVHIHETLRALQSEIEREIIGQSELIENILITFFAGGHALLEGVPGLGKTKTIRTFARVLSLDTGRVSFTPDLLPSDLTGSEIYRPGKGSFEVRKGPIFTNILLADEINRTPPKVQSALLEAMEEKRVTIGDTTLTLPSPFVVFATQNPLEHEGTYPLPEAQLDRFLMRIILDYPNSADEKRIFMQETGYSDQETNTLPKDKGAPDSTLSTKTSSTLELNSADILEMIDYIAKNIRIDEQIYDYVERLLIATRALTQGERPVLAYGASTRAGLALIRAARIRALMHERDYVLPEDIKALAHAVIDHRIGLSYEAMSDGKKISSIIEEILENVRIV